MSYTDFHFFFWQLFIFTYRSSLTAVERERGQLTISLTEDEKCRNSLWKIEKQQICHSETCSLCGVSVYFKGSYEVAKLQKDKLPVARMRLEGLLKDVQDSYCHHQHAALLAHCQVRLFVTQNDLIWDSTWSKFFWLLVKVTIIVYLLHSIIEFSLTNLLCS